MNCLRVWTPLTFLSSPKPCVAVGKFLVSSQTHCVDPGAYQASVTISSGQGSGSHHRIYRLRERFASPEAAHLVALTQGWLHTTGHRSDLC